MALRKISGIQWIFILYLGNKKIYPFPKMHHRGWKQYNKVVLFLSHFHIVSFVEKNIFKSLVAVKIIIQLPFTSPGIFFIQLVLKYLYCLYLNVCGFVKKNTLQKCNYCNLNTLCENIWEGYLNICNTSCRFCLFWILFLIAAFFIVWNL